MVQQWKSRERDNKAMKPEENTSEEDLMIALWIDDPSLWRISLTAVEYYKDIHGCQNVTGLTSNVTSKFIFWYTCLYFRYLVQWSADGVISQYPVAIHFLSSNISLLASIDKVKCLYNLFYTHFIHIRHRQNKIHCFCIFLRNTNLAAWLDVKISFHDVTLPLSWAASFRGRPLN